ncbi:hypothetical protein UNDYM_1986 [Undibacterium sp. YM2]|jgi:hypothetical protein|nr:hypothetical protein UNDYM_1986 [Undibacterium sp. YM2]
MTSEKIIAKNPIVYLLKLIPEVRQHINPALKEFQKQQGGVKRPPIFYNKF